MLDNGQEIATLARILTEIPGAGGTPELELRNGYARNQVPRIVMRVRSDRREGER